MKGSQVRTLMSSIFYKAMLKRQQRFQPESAMIYVRSKVMDVHIMASMCTHTVANKKCYRIMPASFKIKVTRGASATVQRGCWAGRK